MNMKSMVYLILSMAIAAYVGSLIISIIGFLILTATFYALFVTFHSSISEFMKKHIPQAEVKSPLSDRIRTAVADFFRKAACSCDAKTNSDNKDEESKN